MAGIAGLVYYEGDQNQLDQVHNMLEAMPHRGTTLTLTRPSSNIALGLCTDQDPSQSFSTHQSSQLVLDGQIHSELPGQGLGNDSQESQAAHVMAAFEEHRHGLFEKLAGEFALVIWDERRKELTFARDAFGTKPLYFYQSPKFFAFASEIKGLLAISSVPSKLNRDRVADFIMSSLEGIDTRSTFFNGIHRMAAGHYYRLNERSLSSSRHWAPSSTLHGESASTEYIEEFKKLFQEAVECRYKNPDRTAILLSGGLDSCSIAAAAAAHTDQRLNTFSLMAGNKDPWCEESETIKFFQSKNRFNTRNLLPSEVVNTAPTLRTLASSIDNPFTASLIAGPIPLYAIAKASGMRVVVDGVDGDFVSSLTGNYQWFVANEFGITSGCRELIKEARHFDDHWNLPRMLTSFLMRRVSNQLFPRNTTMRVLLRSFQTNSSRSRTIENSPIKTSFSKEVHLMDRFRQQLENEHPRYPFKIRDACSNTLTAPYIVAALERYEEAAAMYSMEATHPFMDLRLVQHCLNVPWHFRTRNGVPKWILRRAMDNQLPSKITNQYKIENIASWFLDEINRNYLLDQPTPPNWLQDILEDFIEIDSLRKDWQEAARSPDSEISELINTSIVLAEWLRHHF